MLRKHKKLGKVTSPILQIKPENTYVTSSEGLKLLRDTVTNLCTQIKRVLRDKRNKSKRGTGLGGRLKTWIGAVDLTGGFVFIFTGNTELGVL